ncbi:MAG: hypothetical protein ACKO0M_08095 [Cyanobium sp.]
MTLTLDRDDIQGNVLLPYSRTRFPIGRLLLLHQDRSRSSDGACRFLQDLLPEITSAQLFESKRTRRWAPIPTGALREATPVLVNVAFTAGGLAAFSVPEATLNGMPPEFLEGMKKRAVTLHDTVEAWDPIWQEKGEADRIDLAILLRVNFEPCLKQAYEQAGQEQRGTKDHHPPAIFLAARKEALRRLDEQADRWIASAGAGDLRVLPWPGQGSKPSAEADPDPTQWLETESLVRTRRDDGILASSGDDDDLRYGEYEHFGFFDGSADPVFEGQFPPEAQAEAVIGQGRLEGGAWQPLATGEFLLGYGDEAQEMPAAALPFSFSRNGTFLVMRQLQQNVADFEEAISRQLPAFATWLGAEDPTGDSKAVRQLLRAKLVGRWEDGTPLGVASSHGEWLAFQAEYRRRLDAAASGDEAAQKELDRFKRQFTDLRYEADDHEGGRCPLTAHIRRCNPRDSGDPRLLDPSDAAARAAAGSILVNRRRILRRGMTYGPPQDHRSGENAVRQPDQTGNAEPPNRPVNDGQKRGLLFMALCTGIARQFEFMQQQWLNYGADFGAGNDVCPISGVMAPQEPPLDSKLMIAAPPNSDRPPFVMRPAPSPVDCRGGAYFFLPSLTALRLIAQGLVDPL